MHEQIRPMEGIKVVEVGVYALVPAAGAVLADWGADVLKIEHPVYGDPIRGLAVWGIPPNTGEITFMYQILNRGKRSVAVDLAQPDGMAILLDLVRGADVFLTNLLPAARRKLGIEPEDLWEVNPKLIYGRGSAYGPAGPFADQGGYDTVVYWSRTGMANAATEPGGDALVAMPSPGYGDVQGGMNLAGGIAAALRARDRAGRGVVVDVSLLGTGMWAMQASVAGSAVLQQEEMPRFAPEAAPNPLGTSYRTKDNRFIVLAMFRSEKYWSGLCTVLDQPALLADERFASFKARARNNVACYRELAKIFAAHDLAHWVEVLSRQEGPWDVARRVSEAAIDPQAVANGYVEHVECAPGRRLPMVQVPVQFNGQPTGLRPAPEFGADTEQALLDMGYSWSTLASLKDRGVIP
ncbi:MAG: CaiB/BaiF CoA transferase family protein [Lautropia sp.]